MGSQAKRDSVRYISNKVHTIAERIKKIDERLSKRITRLRDNFNILRTLVAEVQEIQLAQAKRIGAVEDTLTGRKDRETLS